MEYRNGDVSYPYVSMHKELLATTADSLVSEPATIKHHNSQ